jgi:hypothetical protein
MRLRVTPLLTQRYTYLAVMRSLTLTNPLYKHWTKLRVRKIFMYTIQAVHLIYQNVCFEDLSFGM